MTARARTDGAAAPLVSRVASTRPRRGALWCVVAIAALLRLVMVLAPPADTYPYNDGERIAGEELLRGSATKDFLEGTVLPHLQDYQVQPFWGGTLVVSILAVPFFAVLGPTIVALRLTAVVFAALGAGILFWILDRFASRRAAWIGGLLLACAPPGLSVFGVTAYGAEVENLTFALAAVATFLAYLHGARTRWRGFAAGLAAGFAIYCGYIVVPLVALLVLYWLWLEPGFVLRRATLWPIAGFVVGLWPSIYYNLTHALGGLEVYGEDLSEHFQPAALVAQVGRATFDLVWWDLPGAFYLQRPARFPVGRVLTALFAALALAAAVRHKDSLARALRPPWRASGDVRDVHPSALFLAYLPVHALAYLATDFRVDHERGLAIAYRYLLPFFPFLFLLAGIALDALAGRSRAWRRLALGTAALTCALFLGSNLGYCRFERVRDNWRERGYSDVQFARSVVLRYGGDLESLEHVVRAVAAKRTPEQQERFFFVVAQNYKYFLHEDSRLAEAELRRRPDHARALAYLHGAVPEPYRAFFEPLAPGERVFNHAELELWRRAREARGAH